MGDVEKLMSDAASQLEEHKIWLKTQMQEWMHTQDGGEWKLQFRVCIEQVDNIKLRMSKAEEDNITIVWEYPDEVIAFLRDEKTPVHLRASLEGGHFIDPNAPAISATKALPS